MVVSIFSAIQIEKIGDPKLKITKESNHSKRTEFGMRNYLRIKVTNIPKKSNIVPRKTATSCNGTVKLFDSNNNIVLREIGIRWDRKPEPLFHIYKNHRKKELPDENRFYESRFIDIPPDEGQISTIFMYYENEENAYFWAAENYLSMDKGFRHQEFKIEPGSYRARVTASSGDISSYEDFTLKYDKQTKEWDLTPIVKTYEIYGKEFPI